MDLSQLNTVSTLSRGFALKLQYVWLVKFDFFPGNFQTLRSPCTFAKMEILSGWWTKRHVRTQIPLVRSKIGSFCYIFSEIFNFYKFLATSCFFISCHKSWALLCYSAALSRRQFSVLSPAFLLLFKWNVGSTDLSSTCMCRGRVSVFLMNAALVGKQQLRRARVLLPCTDPLATST